MKFKFSNQTKKKYNRVQVSLVSTGENSDLYEVNLETNGKLSTKRKVTYGAT